MTVTLFNLAGLAIIGWALMIFLPGWSVTKRLVEWAAFPVLISVIYVIGLVVVLMETGLGVVADFGSSDGVVGLLAQPDIALIAWIHILAFDHLVAVGIFRDNLERRVIPLPAQSVVLFLALMFGPLGFLVYWILRMTRGPAGGEGGGVGLAEGAI